MIRQLQISGSTPFRVEGVSQVGKGGISIIMGVKMCIRGVNVSASRRERMSDTYS